MACIQRPAFANHHFALLPGTVWFDDEQLGGEKNWLESERGGQRGVICDTFMLQCAKRIDTNQRVAKLTADFRKIFKILVDFGPGNLFIWFLSGAHSASAPDTGTALKQHQLRDWGNPGREVVVSSGLKIETGIGTVPVAL